MTTGTFLNGLIHVGAEQRPAGRHGEPPSRELAESIRSFGLRDGAAEDRNAAATRSKQHRLRRARRARDSSSRKRGDAVPVPFSFDDRDAADESGRAAGCSTRTIACAISCAAASIASPLFNGQIQGIGPRYCPSLEDKIMRFPDRERHQIYLEPEGLDVDEIYVNGFSMSLPREVQEQLVHALPGLEDARDAATGLRRRIRLRAADRVEVDARDASSRGSVFRRPDQRHLRLRGGGGAGPGGRHQRGATRRAASQPFTLGRDEAYIGILVDDLVTRGCLEPYRMFTSRAEHRLLLRIDNADLRLTPRGRELGLIDDERWDRSRRGARGSTATCRARYARSSATPTGDRVTAAQCFGSRRSGSKRLSSGTQSSWTRSLVTQRLDIASVETAVKYEGYLKQEARERSVPTTNERRRIPSGFPFARVPGLSTEVVQRLSQVRPETLGQASRIPGITPAAVAVLGRFWAGCRRKPSSDAVTSREFQDRLTRRARRAGVTAISGSRGAARDLLPAPRDLESEDQSDRDEPVRADAERWIGC